MAQLQKDKKMRKIRGIAMLVLTILFLAACGSTVTSGSVTDKGHEDAYTYYTQVCSAYKSDGTCMVWIQQPNYVSESWSLTITGKNDKGETESRKIEVSQSMWDKTNINDYIELDEKGKKHLPKTL